MTEIERLRQWEIVGREWLDKTDWMQSKDAPVRWLGKHRADCLREEIERLHAERDALLNALETMLIGACAVGVPHAGERQVLQEAVDSARAVIAAARKG